MRSCYLNATILVQLLLTDACWNIVPYRSPEIRQLRNINSPNVPQQYFADRIERVLPLVGSQSAIQNDLRHGNLKSYILDLYNSSVIIIIIIIKKCVGRSLMHFLRRTSSPFCQQFASGRLLCPACHRPVLSG